jgi:hypothetical protein
VESVVIEAIEKEYNEYTDFKTQKYFQFTMVNICRRNLMGSVRSGEQYYDFKLTPTGRYKKNSLRVNHNSYQAYGIHGKESEIEKQKQVKSAIAKVDELVNRIKGG